MIRKQLPKVRPIAWKKSVLMWLLVVGICVIVALLVVVVLLRSAIFTDSIDSFQKCKDAGGAIAESYPEQCVINGESFMDDLELQNGNDFVGLSEQAALDAAQSANMPARVVERDGESLPVTMDYVVGRLNLYIKDGRVYKVVVEGEE